MGNDMRQNMYNNCTQWKSNANKSVERSENVVVVQ